MGVEWWYIDIVTIKSKIVIQIILFDVFCSPVSSCSPIGYRRNFEREIFGSTSIIVLTFAKLSPAPTPTRWAELAILHRHNRKFFGICLLLSENF